MYKSIGLLLLAMILQACIGQATKSPNTLVGGPCEDCEAALDYQLLGQKLQSVDTLPGYTETSPKLKISG
ncbi:MAG: intradiol ring-cleavage dioxygenase, partial [Bacteroidota bacterium]